MHWCHWPGTSATSWNPAVTSFIGGGANIILGDLTVKPLYIYAILPVHASQSGSFLARGARSAQIQRRLTQEGIKAASFRHAIPVNFPPSQLVERRRMGRRRRTWEDKAAFPTRSAFKRKLKPCYTSCPCQSKRLISCTWRKERSDPKKIDTRRDKSSQFQACNPGQLPLSHYSCPGQKARNCSTHLDRIGLCYTCHPKPRGVFTGEHYVFSTRKAAATKKCGARLADTRQFWKTKMQKTSRFSPRRIESTEINPSEKSSTIKK